MNRNEILREMIPHLKFSHLVVFVSGLILLNCAQQPTKELLIASKRIETAKIAEADLYAAEPLAKAESQFALATKLSSEQLSYREALKKLSQAIAYADLAREQARVNKLILQRRVQRILKELEELVAITKSYGAETQTAGDLTQFIERYLSIKALAAQGNLLTAFDEANQLKPSLLALEQQFRSKH